MGALNALGPPNNSSMRTDEASWVKIDIYLSIYRGGKQIKTFSKKCRLPWLDEEKIWVPEALKTDFGVQK